MKNIKLILAIAALLLAPARASSAEQPLPSQFERSVKVEAPVVLCIDDKPAVGGQPTHSAYAKAAANGFRSVLTLRAPKDGVDPMRERFIVEQNKLSYFNIPAAVKLPRHNQVDEFLNLVREPANHPMLINCAFAERVAPFMLIFRIVEQGWSEDKAVEEASRSGLKSAQLKKFTQEYLASQRKRGRNQRQRLGRRLLKAPPVKKQNVYAARYKFHWIAVEEYRSSTRFLAELDDLVEMIRNTTAAFEHADDLPFVVGDGELVERASGATDDQHDVRRADVDDVAPFVAETRINNHIGAVFRQTVAPTCSLRFSAGETPARSRLVAKRLRHQVRQSRRRARLSEYNPARAIAAPRPSASAWTRLPLPR